MNEDEVMAREETDAELDAALAALDEVYFDYEAQSSYSQMSEYERRKCMIRHSFKSASKELKKVMDERPSSADIIPTTTPRVAMKTPKKLEYPAAAPASKIRGVVKYRARDFDLKANVMYGYVFDLSLWAEVSVILQQARGRYYDSVLSYGLCVHDNAICEGLRDQPTNHWHLSVWYKAGKPTDTRFHRTFFKGSVKRVNLNSSLIRVYIILYIDVKLSPLHLLIMKRRELPLSKSKTAGLCNKLS